MSDQLNTTRERLQTLAECIDAVLNGTIEKGTPREWGFILGIFPFENPDTRFNYVSNADRETIVFMLREIADKFERDVNADKYTSSKLGDT